MTADDAPFRLRTFAESAGVSLARFDHPHGAPLDDTEEQAAGRFQINVVERGWFRLGYETREWTLGAGSVFVSRPGDVYRYAHLPRAEPDVCLSIAFSDALARDLEDTFRRLAVVAPMTNRLAWMRMRLGAFTAGGDALAPGALDALACEMLAAADCAGDERRRLYRPQQLRWYAQRISAARERIDADPAGPHSLWQLAARAAMSPYLFARVFGELIGAPPHTYVIRVRLRRARELLEAGMSVTDACYASGFNNLSHFIRTFRAHFGHRPSALKPRGRGRAGP